MQNRHCTTLWAQYNNKGNARLAREIYFFFKAEDVSGRSGFDLTFILEEVFYYAECRKSMWNSKLPPDLCSPCPATACSPCTYPVQMLYHTGPAGKRPVLQSIKRHKYFFNKNRQSLHHQIWKQEDLSSRWQQQTSLESKDSICRLQKALCRTVHSALHLPEVCSFHSL